MSDGFTQAWADHINALTNDVRALQKRNSELEKELSSTSVMHSKNATALAKIVMRNAKIVRKCVELLEKEPGAAMYDAVHAYSQAYVDTWGMLSEMSDVDQRDAACEAAGQAAWDKELADAKTEAALDTKTLRAVGE